MNKNCHFCQQKESSILFNLKKSIFVRSLSSQHQQTFIDEYYQALFPSQHITNANDQLWNHLNQHTQDSTITTNIIGSSIPFEYCKLCNDSYFNYSVLVGLFTSFFLSKISIPQDVMKIYYQLISGVPVDKDKLWTHLTQKHSSPVTGTKLITEKRKLENNHNQPTKKLKQTEIVINKKHKILLDQVDFTHHHKKYKPYVGPTMRHNGAVVPARCKVDTLLLARINAHPRDQHVIFDEDPHIYYLDGHPVSISVTGLNHSMFGEFIKREAMDKMFRNNGSRFPHEEHHMVYRKLPIWCVRKDLFSNETYDIDEWQEGAYLRYIDDLTPSYDVVGKHWDANGANASKLGTILHRNCELYCNQETVDDESQEFQYFLNFFKAITDDGLIPYRSEQVLWVQEMDLAGSVDIQFVKIDPVTGKKTYYLKDWKRSKQIKLRNRFQNGIGLARHMEDTNYNHYTLQLNMYKFIIEKYYGIKFESMSILIFHPNQENYVEIFLEDKQDLIQKIYEQRVSQIAALRNRYNPNNIFLSLLIYSDMDDVKQTINYNELDQDTTLYKYSTVIEIDSKTGKIVNHYIMNTFYSSMLTLIDDDQKSLDILQQVENCLQHGTFSDYKNKHGLEIGDILVLSSYIWFKHIKTFTKATLIDNDNTYKLF